MTTPASPEQRAPRGGGAPGPRQAPWDPRFFARSALFWPIRPAAERFAGFEAWPTIDDYNAAVGEGLPVRFEVQPPRPRRRRRRGPVDRGALYDAQIHVGGRVPTRPRNWHDFLNMLVWAVFPRAKAALHARQHRMMEARLEEGATRLPAARTREQDGLALLDEGSVLLLCEAGRAPEARRALEGRRPDDARAIIVEGAMSALVFGHALYESLVLPGPPIHAMVHVLPCPAPLPAPGARAALADALLCEEIGDPASFLDPGRFCSLPLDEGVLCGA